MGRDEAAIRGVIGAWSAALAARDVDGLMAHYAPDAVIISDPDVALAPMGM